MSAKHFPFLCCILTLAPRLANSAPAAPPLPEIAISKARTPPVIDGKLSTGEWDHATAVTGFVTAFDKHLARAQTVAWITYDDQYLYIALKNNRAASVNFLSKHGRRPDDDSIVFDPSNEIWVTPPGTPITTYQTLFNSYPAVLDAKMIPSVGYTARSWNGKWEFASSETTDNWIVEARAPLSSFGADKIQDGSVWHGLFTADVFADPDKFRAWAAGGAFADTTRHGVWRFFNQSPVFQLLDVESIFSGHFSFPMALAADAEAPAQADVTLRFGPQAQAQPGDLVLNRKVSAAAGQRQEMTLAGDLTALNLPSVKEDEPGQPAAK